LSYSKSRLSFDEIKGVIVLQVGSYTPCLWNRFSKYSRATSQA